MILGDQPLLGTKLRALYQRRKGRDLFDLVASHTSVPDLQWDDIVRCFHTYMDKEEKRVTRAEFEENMHYKMQDPFFLNDLSPLLSPAFSEKYSPTVGFDLLQEKIFPRFSSEAWKMGEPKERTIIK